jgi:hypothetical protein
MASILLLDSSRAENNAKKHTSNFVLYVFLSIQICMGEDGRDDFYDLWYAFVPVCGRFRVQ